MKHPVIWHNAAPLWDLALDQAALDQGGAEHPRFHRPEILRFANDAFMDELEALLAEDPAGLADRVARQETWEDERAGWQDSEDGAPIDLYQPVHQRFYLLAASLVCRLPGLPDRLADPAKERLSFVIRRLAPTAEDVDVDANDPSTFNEQAWIGDRRGGEWAGVDGSAVAAGEERLPLFAHVFELEGRKRRLLAGLLPVAGRELYQGSRTRVEVDEAEGGAGVTTSADATTGAIYVARCVYERPDCARFEPPVVSRPSRPFRLASFFDPAAPVRPVTIRLPVDTSEGGLRGFGKGVSFLLSNQLRRQMAQLEGQSLDDLDQGNGGTDPGQLDLGEIWILSIPIITLCAFILLMVIVNVLNFFFQWLPFFRIRIPLNLKVGT
ncbi:MAG: hypothetical protein MPN21_11825 [Thermoanaerobaculia bacterium]|nr:hypothetical protein [Thermoanaerobaculia bacterium]